MPPKYLLKITEWPRPYFSDSDVEPLISYHPCTDEAEADAYIQDAGRPGFGKQVTRVIYEKYMIATIPRGSVEAEPITMLEGALDYHVVAGESRVNVKLYGRRQDGPSVFWDSRENSFAIVKPNAGHENDRRFVSDQGVVLVSINGIGEIRWTVQGRDARCPENLEAVNHFRLTWGE